VMFVILFLIVAVAAFNLVSALVMLVVDKQPDIAIPRTLGMRPAGVLIVFVTQGMVIGISGTALGLVAGALLAANINGVVSVIQSIFGVQLFPTDIFYATGIPSVTRPTDLAWIAASSLGACLLSTLYPAWRAARTRPASALRFD
jgi:lipoprotein-releasing system permease protein